MKLLGESLCLLGLKIALYQNLKLPSLKDTVKRIKCQAIDLKEMFAKHISDKGYISRILTELSKPSKKTKNPI